MDVYIIIPIQITQCGEIIQRNELFNFTLYKQFNPVKKYVLHMVKIINGVMTIKTIKYNLKYQFKNKQIKKQKLW